MHVVPYQLVNIYPGKWLTLHMGQAITWTDYDIA